jgi:hypothetical protein
MASTQQDRSLEGTHFMYDVRLATRITTGVDRRLRMLALAKSQPLSHVLVSLLDQVLPPADELASLLGHGHRYDHDPELETETAA